MSHSPFGIDTMYIDYPIIDEGRLPNRLPDGGGRLKLD
jgi:hypothetical protein